MARSMVAVRVVKKPGVAGLKTMMNARAGVEMLRLVISVVEAQRAQAGDVVGGGSPAWDFWLELELLLWLTVHPTPPHRLTRHQMSSR